MAGIRVLDYNLINKIAAGEVVERPASVVKELTENAVDAGASALTVEIKDGGLTYIRVTDNGCGIPADEVKTAFMQHATSKIRTLNDLSNVMSLGFRGEALSSVAAVAQVEMLTKTQSGVSGSRIVINGGKVESLSEIGCAQGTTVVVRNLFFNTPARRKFMKKPQAEAAAVSELLGRLALARPDIAVTYIVEGKIIIQTVGKDLKTAILNIYGRELTQKLIEVWHIKDYVTVTGFAARPEAARANRGYEHFYINGRYVKSELARAAVEEAYKTRLPIGRFPVYVLQMSVPPDKVDVNVHPNKLEVRFADEETVYSCLLDAVTEALGDKNLIPEAVFYDKRQDKNEKQAVVLSENEPAPPRENMRLSDIIYAMDKPAIAETGDASPQRKESYTAPVPPPPEKPLPKPEKKEEIFKDYRIIGQVFNTYWIIEAGNSVYLMDQHAAHERVLYEKIISEIKVRRAVSQRLLEPLTLELTHKETEVLKDNMELFVRSGFDIAEAESGGYALAGVPLMFKTNAGSGFFIQILDKLMSIETSVENAYQARLEAIAVQACKAAVKGNDRLNEAEAAELIHAITGLDNPFTCPHGRPTIIEITKYELERRFKRT